MKLSDEILLKFSDGSLDHAEMQEVAQSLKSDADARKRLQLMEISGSHLASEREQTSHAPLEPGQFTDNLARQILSGELDTVEEEGTPKVSALSGEQMQSKRPKGSFFADRRALAASLVFLGIGLLSGLYIHATLFSPYPNKATGEEISAYPTWLMRVVDYHTLYGRETIEGAHADASDIANYQKQFSATLGTSVIVPDLSLAKWHFKRGQVLKFDGAPIIQLVYLPEGEGRPIAFCSKRTGGPDMKSTYADIRDLGVVRWRTRGTEYLLLGHADQKKIKSAASDIQKLFAKRS